MTSSTADGEPSFTSLTESSGEGEEGVVKPSRAARRRVAARRTARIRHQARRAMDGGRVRRAGLIVATVGFGLGVWFLRRPDQFLHPYVWVEEYQVLNRYQTQGL